MFKRLGILLLLLSGCSPEPVEKMPGDSISWAPLLGRAGGMEPQPFTESRLFSSSSGTVALTGYAPEKYGDLDHGSFLEIRETDEGVEAVLAEAEGAGAVTWIWSANPAGELVLEIDGRKTVMPFRKFLEGRWLPDREVFSGKTAEGFNLHFPIIHSQRLRISLRAENRGQLGSLFYQIAWNRIEPDLPVVPFSASDIAGSRKLLKQLSDDWQASEKAEWEKAASIQLAPNEMSCVLRAACLRSGLPSDAWFPGGGERTAERTAGSIILGRRR